MRKMILFAALALTATAAEAQILPFLAKRDGPAQPAAVGIDAERAEFAATTGGTTVYFPAGSSVLGTPYKVVLTAQAAWIRRHPDVVVRVEGYGDTGDTRDHALALGARRAEEARDYLVLLGVPSAQVSTTSWGNERSGLGRAVTVLVR
jgi:peptidoglycan-associated lipoprotein